VAKLLRVRVKIDFQTTFGAFLAEFSALVGSVSAVHEIIASAQKTNPFDEGNCKREGDFYSCLVPT